MGTKVNLGFMFEVGGVVSVAKVRQTITNLSSCLYRYPDIRHHEKFIRMTDLLFVRNRDLQPSPLLSEDFGVCIFCTATTYF